VALQTRGHKEALRFTKQTNKQTMKIDKKYKLESACSIDPDRAMIMHPWIPSQEGLRGYAVATDGRMLAVVPIECAETEIGYRVHAKALKEARKCGGKKTESAWVGLAPNETTAPDNSVYALPPMGGRWLPDVTQVIPDKTRPCVFSISLDASLLMKLAEALGNVKVRLEFCDDKSAILVYPSEDNEAFGALMPLRKN